MKKLKILYFLKVWCPVSSNIDLGKIYASSICLDGMDLKVESRGKRKGNLVHKNISLALQQPTLGNCAEG